MDLRFSHLFRWLAVDAVGIADTGELLGALCLRLLDAGLSLSRVSLGLPILHPLVRTVNYVWVRGEGVHRLEYAHGIEHEERYLDSPIARLQAGEHEVRRRLSGPGVVLDFPVLRELLEAGATDYLAASFRSGDGTVNCITWTCDAVGGFRRGDLALLRDLLPVLGLQLEARTQRRIARAVLSTYLGTDVGRRVLEGQIRRGDVETIHAVIWVSDLRNFTGLSRTLPRDELVRLLNQGFERLVIPIQEEGGEVLKFLGDGLMAIFRVTPEVGGAVAACAAALRAYRRAWESLETFNRRHRGEPGLPLRFGTALHLGELEFGNIGGPDRLDFTIIGEAVNLASRIEGRCAILGRELLLSESVAEALLEWGEPVSGVGEHALKGLPAPVPLFTVELRPVEA